MKKMVSVLLAIVILFSFSGFVIVEDDGDSSVDAVQVMMQEVLARDGEEGFTYVLLPTETSTEATMDSDVLLGSDSIPQSYVVMGTKEAEDGSVIKQYIEPFVLEENTGEPTNAFVVAQELESAGISPMSTGWVTKTQNNITLKYQAYYTTYSGAYLYYVPDKVSAYYTSSNSSASVSRLQATYEICGDLYNRSTGTLLESTYVKTASINQYSPSNTYSYSSSMNFNSSYGVRIVGMPPYTNHWMIGSCILTYSYNGTTYKLMFDQADDTGYFTIA